MRQVLAFCALACALLWAGLALADKGDPREVEAQRLVHLLGYVSADYGVAVDADGRVVNKDEYDEQIALLKDAAKIAGRLAKDAGQPDLAAAVGEVQRVVESKAAPAAVSAAIDPLRERVVGTFKLAQAPARSPSAMHARALWLEHCTTCHGTDGKADTARAQSLQPKPTNFHDPEIGAALTPFRVQATVRFGVNGTAMVPFTFLSNEERWDLALYVTGLRHLDVSPGPPIESPTYALGELSVRSDAQLLAELAAAGIPDDRAASVLSDLRRRAPYEDRAQVRPLGLARGRLDRARVAIAQGDLDTARGLVIDAYLMGVEPAEGALMSVDPDLVRDIERRFMRLRADVDSRAAPAVLNQDIAGLLGEIGRAEAALASAKSSKSFAPSVFNSAMIVLREGVEAALLVAALLAIAAQAGVAQRRRWVHAGWAAAIAAGVLTFIASMWIVEGIGAKRELVEGVTALIATGVLFYVSYSLIAKREVARWMKFLRSQVSPRRAALSLFGISFVAAYREAFETVLFFQGILAGGAPTAAVLLGIAVGAVALVTLVAVYTRAGRFTPPQTFFKVSSWLLYALAFVFIGQGLASLQKAGAIPVHALTIPLPSVPLLGIYPTLETCLAQLALVILAAIALRVGRRDAGHAASARPAAT